METERKILIRGKDVTEFLTCPICKQLPKASVYQCQNGHVLCGECYPGVKSCPECRYRLPHKSHGLRNLQIEKILDEVLQVECFFKGNGCGKKIHRNLVENHASVCSYNFQKFGNFVNLCKVLGYPSCTFQVNNGNTAVAIQHFQTQHGFHLTNSERFQVELEHFKEAISAQTSSHFWTPVIVKLPGSQGHLLLAPLLNKDEDFAYLSIWFPDSSSYHQSSEIQTQVKYTVPQGELSEPCKLVFHRRPMSISEAATLSFETLPQPFHSLFLKKHMRNEEKLRIICKIKENNFSSNEESELETFSCKIHPPLLSDPSAGATDKAKNWLEDIAKQTKLDRERLWNLLRKLFEDNSNSDGFTAEEMAYLKHEALVLVLWRGTVDQLNYLISKGSNINYIFEDRGITSLHYVLCSDSNQSIGLEKVKVLVTSGVDFNRLNIKNQNVLHYAAFYGTEQTVKYFLEELKLDGNAKAVSGLTPLHFAVMNENEDCGMKIVRLLLDHGADPGVKSKNGNDLLDLANPNYKEKLEDILRRHQENLK